MIILACTINRSIIDSEYAKFCSEHLKIQSLDPVDWFEEKTNWTLHLQKIFALIIGNHFETEINRLMEECFISTINNYFVQTYVNKIILDTQIFRLFDFNLKNNPRKTTTHFTKKFSKKNDPLSLDCILNEKRKLDTDFTTGEGNFISLMDLRNKLAHNIKENNPNNSIDDLYSQFQSAANSIDTIFQTIIAPQPSRNISNN